MIDPRGYSDETLEVLRLLAIHAKQEGYSVATIAAVLGVHPDTVYRWLSGYDQHGQEGLPGKRTGRPPGVGRILSPEQEAEIQAIVAKQLPSGQEIEAATWTRRAVRELIYRLYDFWMPERTVGEYLRRWNFTNKRAARHDPAQDPKQVEEWKEETYPAIQAKAEKEDAKIEFADETGCQAKGTPGYGYAPVGVTPKVEMTSNRIKVNVLLRMSKDGTFEYHLYRENMTGPVFIKYLEQWIAGEDQKRFLIVDRLPAHQSTAVEEWLAAHADRIEVFPLPPHAPETNPVEYANQDLKAHVFAGGYPRTRAELCAKVQSFLSNLKSLPEKIASYFKHPEVQYV